MTFSYIRPILKDRRSYCLCRLCKPKSPRHYIGAIMTIPIKHEVSLSGLEPKPKSKPHMVKTQSGHCGSCANERCRKGSNGTRGALKSSQTKYCCAYCRVDVCRRSRPKPEQIKKPTRKRRRDAKYGSHSERQRAHYARYRYLLTQPIKDYLGMGTRRAGARAAPRRRPAGLALRFVVAVLARSAERIVQRCRASLTPTEIPKS